NSLEDRAEHESADDGGDDQQAIELWPEVRETGEPPRPRDLAGEPSAYSGADAGDDPLVRCLRLQERLCEEADDEGRDDDDCERSDPHIELHLLSPFALEHAPWRIRRMSGQPVSDVRYVPSLL